MPLKLADAWQAVQSVDDNWRLPGEPAFAKSHAYELLLYDLHRYTREEVGGRSFLIAGHRGAGKTATVVQAVRHLRNEIFKASKLSKTMPVGRRSRVQRPLLVKLVGQSLIEPPPKLKSGDDKKAGGAAAGSQQAQAGQEAAASQRAAEPGASHVESALVHMTIGLYRALAAEYAEAFRNHVSREDNEERADRLELAAQFELDLDTAPTPANLRPYWSLIGRLENGILWPAACDAAFKDNKIHGRGLREVVAIVTAAQAYQVCSGAVTYEETTKETDNKKNVTSSGLDTKQLVTRLGAIGAGTLAGSVVGVGEGALPGVGTGLLVWILASATLNWTGERTRERDRKLEYSFIRDSSIQTLDRDLPLVIDRIREAGLAPVFVIDELDKLGDRQEQTVRVLIRRLKHLVADYGFFCFLTGRDYFDLVAQRIAHEIYPSEHTYFSERLLVINRPDDLFGYLLGLVGNRRDEVWPLPAAVFALSMMFWAKLNFTDVIRKVSTVTGESGFLTCTDEELEAPGRYRLAATVQIAVNRILALPEVAERMKDDPSFAQMALDTLYYIPRCWETNSDKPVEVGPDALRRHLLHRMGRDEEAEEPPAGPNDQLAGAPDPAGNGGPAVNSEDEPAADEAAAHETGQAAPAAQKHPPISPPDLRELVRLLEMLVVYLGNFALLRKELEEEAATIEKTRLTDAQNLRTLAQIVIAEKERLIEPWEATA